METERLVLREITEEDTQLIVRWRSDPEICRYFAALETITEDSHLHWFHNDYGRNDLRIDFMAVEKESLERAGVFSIRRDAGNPCRCEIGYLLDKKMRRKGYAQEGVKRIMRFAGEVWNCKEAVCSIHEDNKASRMLVYRLGFKEISRKDSFVMYYVVINIISRGGGGIGLK